MKQLNLYDDYFYWWAKQETNLINSVKSLFFLQGNQVLCPIYRVIDKEADGIFPTLNLRLSVEHTDVIDSLDVRIPFIIRAIQQLGKKDLNKT
jgi:hypothetical protein